MSASTVADPNEIRLSALKREVERFETVADFARHYDLDATYIRQLLSGHRSFGERAARNMGEKIANDADYFAVSSDASPNLVKLPAQYKKTTREAIAIFEGLDTHSAELALANLKGFVANCKSEPRQKRRKLSG